ncbi:MAG: leucyl aminopeptidase family protein, partial [Pseudomonadota bacterium]
MTDAIPISLVAPADLDDLLAELPPTQAALARAQKFNAKFASHVALPDGAGEISRVLVGRGDAKGARRGRFVFGSVAKALPAGRYRLETALPPEEATIAALGWHLGQYAFTRFKEAPPAGAELIPPEGVDPDRLAAIAEGSTLARDLINTPANYMGPAALEEAARTLAAQHGAAVTVTTGDALLEANLPLIHAVGRAGPQAPRLIELTWGRGTPVTLVGKGVCFDTGGLNLKPGNSMGLMKKDMGGAANILGLAHMVMARGLPVALRVLIPAVENSVASASMRPGDVLTARNGLTVEINNTDAEGRLVLADALALGAEATPALMLDFATLTGAARVALGPDLPPFYTDDEDLAAGLA